MTAAAGVLSATASPSHAMRDLPAWPVRVNVSMPLGSTWGRERLHGFTWGFRSALLAYPTASGRGPGLGAMGDLLIDAKTHQMWSLGGVATFPVVKLGPIDFRVGGIAGTRGSLEPGDDGRRLLLGTVGELAGPAYLYDFRLAARLDATIDDAGVSATSLLFEVDVVAVLGLVIAGASGVR
jgi:hypothetical protein